MKKPPSLVDLRMPEVQEAVGSGGEEVVSLIPSRHILNARGELTPTQILGKARCLACGFSALVAPSAVNPKGFCLDIFVDRLAKGESVSIVDSEGACG